MSYRSSAANAGLLAYAITTNPLPIQVSPKQGNPSMASLVITVSNNTMNAIYCNKITFSFTVGDLAQDFASKADGILVSSNPSAKWKLDVTGSGIFTATPVKPENNLITTDGLSFQIFNITVNNEVGTFTLDVTEESSTDNKTFTKKDNSYDLGKFPYGFYVGNFTASSPMVNHDQPVTLNWSGSDLATYTLVYDTNSIDVTNVRTYVVQHLKNITTFALLASVKEKGETADIYLYVTVTVANPDIVATTLKVLQASSLMGTTIDSTLNVTGDTTVNSITANVITAKSGLKVEGGETKFNSLNAGTLGVTGTSTLLNISAGGTLGVTGLTTLGAANITGHTNITGLLKASGIISMMTNISLLASGTNIPQKTYSAKTDGFIISFIDTPGYYNGQACAVSKVLSSGIWFKHAGGNMVGAAFNTNMVPNPSTMTVPVAAGSTFAYTASNESSNAVGVTVYIYWCPLGGTAAGESSFEMRQEADVNA